MTKREAALAAAKVAGYHGDGRYFTRLVIESRVARPILNAAYAEGQRLKAGGIPCGCVECKGAGR